MTSQATVSAIIPVRNGSNYVLEALSSCRSQTVPMQEIIVVDDGSTDGTADLVRAQAWPEVRVVSLDWGGVGKALNVAIAAADISSNFIAFLDHDDLWLPTKTELQLRALQAEPHLDAVFGYVSQFITPEIGTEEAARVHVPIEPQPGVTLSAMMIRRQALARFDPFPETRDAFAFPPWFMKAQQQSIATKMPSAGVAKRRVHLGNSTRVERAHYNEMYLDLARAAALSRRMKQE